MKIKHLVINNEIQSIVGDPDNIKVFKLGSGYISDNDNIQILQEAVDYTFEGGMAIISSGSDNYFPYYTRGSTWIYRNLVNNHTTGQSGTGFDYDVLRIKISNGVVTGAIISTSGGDQKVLCTNVNYSTPYTPLYDGSPATKKYVDDSVSGAVSKGSTAPSSPAEGQLWYDTTNDQLKVYDGANWNVTGKEYNAGEGIGIGNKTDYSAMQGPSPDGFHVPQPSEYEALCGILTNIFGMASNATTMKTYLKMPAAGYRSNSSSDRTNKGSSGGYWASTAKSTNAYYLSFFSSSLNTQGGDRRANAYSIRPFKDEAVIPDSSWTILYDGSSIATGAGIFHNSTLGLISVSGDGQTWYTIADKNLGATTVYNDGDTLSEANCGYYYQWGNNYGFAWTGGVTTSSTKVDASNYGPGNYYSSSTFIKSNSSPYDWSSVQNDNLRGGVTGVVTLENAITNTGVLSVNGQTGDVSINAGDGIDITNNEVSAKVGEGLEIGTYKDYSAMKGPCPEGFHVPLKSELTTLYSYMNTLGLTDTGANFKAKLLLPNALYRNQNTGNPVSTSSYAYLISCEHYYDSGVKAIQIANTSIYYSDSTFMSKTQGLPIRPFYNIQTIPNSSWTTLYDGSSIATGAGIFHSAVLGLISISADGINRITIADKNLGATTVYNNGDTLTEANCGKLYQWGNNYGFPYSGTITTSSTKVDVSTYGPGNYYNSNTFITAADQTNREARDTPVNNNLRGGVTGVVTLENVITNTGVLSVNGQTGNVTVEEPIEYNAGEGIEIGTAQDYSAMRGPAPTGYHVPQSSEWIALCGILTSTFGMDSNATTMGTYLKMPSAGLRSSSSSNVSDVGTYGRYWSSTASSVDYAYRLSFSSSSLNPQEGYVRTYGFPVRCFKDTPVIPDSSWDVLYQGTGSAGVFRNSSLGLISVSGDGTTWYTIQDKNLGATTVYNQGDTLSDANCGYFYQWGNNYGFPHSGTVTTSATQVDTNDYGPGNYYSSSTFITRSSSPYDRSSVNNKNLRGGETGVVTLDNAITNTGVLSVNGQTGDVAISEGEMNNVKEFTLSSLNDLTNAQAAYDWYVNGGTPIVLYNKANLGSSLKGRYYIDYSNSNGLVFNSAATNTGGTLSSIETLSFLVSGSSVAMITQGRMSFSVVSSLPASPDANTIYFVK